MCNDNKENYILLYSISAGLSVFSPHYTEAPQRITFFILRLLPTDREGEGPVPKGAVELRHEENPTLQRQGTERQHDKNANLT